MPAPTQPAAAPTTCGSCQTPLESGAAFCGACGAAVSVAAPAPTPPAPTPPTSCPSCRSPLRQGARFCRKCGTNTDAAAAVSPAATPAGGPAPARKPSAQSITDQFTWSSAAAGAGFIVAAVSPFLAWASVGGFSAAPFDSGARFRLGDVMGADSMDGLAVVVLAIAGLAALLALLSGRLEAPTGAYWTAGIGAALAALGLLEIQFVISRPGPLDVGFGLYLLVAGGLVAAASPWIPRTKLTGR